MSLSVIHPNEELVRASYAAFARREMTSVMQLFSDDITFVVSGRSIQSGTFSGKDAVGRYFAICREHTAGTHRIEVLDVLANDTRVVALLRASGEHGDAVFDMTVVHVWRVSGATASEVSIIPTDQYAFDAFWS